MRPAYREVYFAKPEMGGGAINDMITHMYNVGDWLAGPIRRLVTDHDRVGVFRFRAVSDEIFRGSRYHPGECRQGRDSKS